MGSYPSQRVSSGISVINGVMTSQMITGEMALVTRPDWEIRAASSMPSAVATAKPMRITFRVKMKCGQMSTGNFSQMPLTILLGAGRMYSDMPVVRAMISKNTNKTASTTSGAITPRLSSDFLLRAGLLIVSHLLKA